MYWPLAVKSRERMVLYAEVSHTVFYLWMAKTYPSMNRNNSMLLADRAYLIVVAAT